MDQDLRLQRALDRVELASGVGDRRQGRMCVMSLAACLAGEDHTDSPDSASRLIGRFAIPINDHMPHEARQRLKVFAPRLLGTNDGRDKERAEVLRRALAEETLPRAALSLLHPGGPPASAAAFRCAVGSAGPLGRLWLRLHRNAAERRAAKLLAEFQERSRRPGEEAEAASAAARLFCLWAREAADAREAEWYWNAAIGLLDRLCDVGAEARRAAPAAAAQADRLERAHQVPEARWLAGEQTSHAVAF